ncbi:hypothetical protein HHI36_017889, partial [Cryptolaemus montrouzieri]
HILNLDKYTFIQQNTTTKLTVTVCTFGFYIPYVICHHCLKNKGLNVDFLEMVFELIQVKIEYKILPYGGFSYDKYFKDYLVNETCDFMIAGNGAVDGRVEFFFPINDDYDVWLVPTPKPIPKWKYIVKAFSTTIWLSCLLALVLEAIVWTIYEISISKEDFLPETIYKIVSYLLEKTYIILRIFLEATVKLRIQNISQAIIVVIVVFPLS